MNDCHWELFLLFVSGLAVFAVARANKIEDNVNETLDEHLEEIERLKDRLAKLEQEQR